MREEVLRMDHVTRVVDGSACLTDLSLHLFCGEILGLLCMSDHGEDELVELVQKNLPLHYGFVYFDEQLVNSYRKSPMTRNRAAVIDLQSSAAPFPRPPVCPNEQRCRPHTVRAPRGADHVQWQYPP